MKKSMFIKILLFAFFVIFMGNCKTSPSASDAKPQIDRPNSIVFDAHSYGTRYYDYVKVYSLIMQPLTTFTVFGYNAHDQRWVPIGIAKLKYVKDRDTIDSPYNGRLKQFRWFAIQSNDGLDFDIGVIIDSNDVKITVIDK